MNCSALQELLKDHPSLELINDKNKIKCNLTKHEMPATVSAIQSYINGKRYKKIRANKTYNYDQLKPHIVPSTKKKHLHELFCTLTLRHIGKSPDDVQRHINGKRYKKALARWQKCKETGEKFVPREGRPKKAVPSDNSSMSGGEPFWSDNSDDNDDAEDDMMDLYPDEDFKNGAENCEEDDGAENCEQDDGVESCEEEDQVESCEEDNRLNHQGAEKTTESDSDYSFSELDKYNIENISTSKSSCGDSVSNQDRKRQSSFKKDKKLKLKKKKLQ